MTGGEGPWSHSPSPARASRSGLSAEQSIKRHSREIDDDVTAALWLDFSVALAAQGRREVHLAGRAQHRGWWRPNRICGDAGHRSRSRALRRSRCATESGATQPRSGLNELSREDSSGTSLWTGTMEARAALSEVPATRLSPFGRAAVLLVRRYQNRAACRGSPSCRYRPTCSAYTLVSIERYGLLIGGARSVRRILRCRPPFGGVDEP